MNSFGLPAKVGQLEALKYSQIESNLYSVSFAQIKSFSPCDKIDIDRQSSFEKSNLDTNYNEIKTKTLNDFYITKNGESTVSMILTLFDHL